MFSLVILFAGLAIGIPSYVTWSRRWPGVMAGFDPDRCTDVEGLTRRVGTAGIALGGWYLLSAAVAAMEPSAPMRSSAPRLNGNGARSWRVRLIGEQARFRRSLLHRS